MDEQDGFGERREKEKKLSSGKRRGKRENQYRGWALLQRGIEEEKSDWAERKMREMKKVDNLWKKRTQFNKKETDLRLYLIVHNNCDGWWVERSRNPQPIFFFLLFFDKWQKGKKRRGEERREEWECAGKKEWTNEITDQKKLSENPSFLAARCTSFSQTIVLVHHWLIQGKKKKVHDKSSTPWCFLHWFNKSGPSLQQKKKRKKVDSFRAFATSSMPEIESIHFYHRLSICDCGWLDGEVLHNPSFLLSLSCKSRFWLNLFLGGSLFSISFLSSLSFS